MSSVHIVHFVAHLHRLLLISGAAYGLVCCVLVTGDGDCMGNHTLVRRLWGRAMFA